MQRAEEEVQRPALNWYLIVNRWILIIIFCICLTLNILNSVYNVAVITYYSTCSECEFTVYEGLVLTASLVMIGVLLLGIYLVLMQRTHALRFFNMTMFLCTWLQMMLILVLTQRYPIAHDVHYRWLQGKSLKDYENKYGCCGVLGPDDYLLTSGELPSSCFDNGSKLTKDLHYSGCLNKDSVSSTFLRFELIISLFQLLLVVVLIQYYLHLKKIAAPVRSFRILWQSRIIL